ncbi:MAG: hypothetical protein CMH52_03820 [Myxococcales bacterium]|nr:hypothetical protein [Myxococcales bacterium]
MVRVALLASILLFGLPVLAETDDADWGDDQDEFGFADTPDLDPSDQPTLSALQLKGFFRSRAGFWLNRLDDDPVSTLRQSLDLDGLYKGAWWRVVIGGHVEYDGAYELDEARYDDATLASYRARYFPREQYLSMQLKHVDLKVGRQTVAWGEGDVFSPLDIVNPRDLREPGLADLDDIRLSILATQLGILSPYGRFELIATHEGYFGEQPSPLSEYSPLANVLRANEQAAAFLDDRTLKYKHSQSRYDLDSGNILARWLLKSEGIDLGLYYGWLRDRQGVVVLPDGFEQLDVLLNAGLSADALAGFPTSIDLELDHRRYSLTGASMAFVTGSFVAKSEWLVEFGKPYNTGRTSPSIPTIGIDTMTVLTGMAGVTYSGFGDTILSFEAQQSYPLSGGAHALFPVSALQTAARVSRTYLRERLQLDIAATAIGLGAQYGWLTRGGLAYELVDALKLTALYVHYGAGTASTIGPFDGFKTHDQVWLQIRWDFQIL